jgi:hypothetical protein
LLGEWVAVVGGNAIVIGALRAETRKVS